MRLSTPRRALLSVALAVALLGGCKTAGDESAALSVPISPRALNYVFLVSQGFYSCTYAHHTIPERIEAVITARLAALAQRRGGAAPALRAVFVQTCFTGGMVQNGGSEQLLVSVRERPGDAAAGVPVKPAAVVEIVKQYCRRLSAAGKPARVVMLGHSHGGWLVMDAASKWDDSGDLRYLFTLDPISYTRCSQGALIVEKAMRMSPLGSLFASAECTKAPSDLAPQARQIAAKVSQSWRNFFQTDFPFLHSGPIPGAFANLSYSYKGSRFAHADVLYDERIWSTIDLLIGEDVENAVAGDDDAGRPQPDIAQPDN
jgi:hypothetical protein